MLQRRTLWISALYAASAALFFLPALWHHWVPLPLENTYYVPGSLWHRQPHAPLTYQSNAVLGDITGYYYPYMAAAVPRLQQGHIPLWNPQIFSGMPFMAALQPAVLYPLNIIFSPLGPQWIWVATAIVRMWLMGWGLHLFMRRMGVRDTAALWSGLSYQLCGSSIAWLHFPLHSVLAWLPLALYATDRLLSEPKGRWFLLLVACLATQFLGGHPETSVLFVLVWASWTALHMPWRQRRVRLTLLALAGPAALGLTLPQLLPAIPLIRDSATLLHRPQSAPYIGTWSNLKQMFLVLNPYLYGTPLNNHYWGQGNSYLEWVVYMGVLTVPLVLVGILTGKPRRCTLYWTVLAVLSLGLRFPLPGLAALYRLPLLQLGLGIRFNLSWSLAAAVLAGLGVEALLDQRPWSRHAFVGTATIATVALLWSVFDIRYSTIMHRAPFFIPRPGQIVRHNIAILYSRSNAPFVVLLVMALVASIVAWLVFVPKLRHWVPVLLLPCLYIDLAAQGMPFNASVTPAAIYPPTPITARLRSLPGFFRIDILQTAVMENNVSMTQGLDNATGYEDVVGTRYDRFVNHRRKISGTNNGSLVIQPPAQRFFDVANVQFLLTTTPISTAGPWSLWQQDKDVRVYRNAAVLPRVFAVNHVQLATPDTSIETAFAPNLDPRRVAVVEEAVPHLAGATTARGARPLSAQIAITHYAPEEVTLSATVDQPALVVLSDSYAPGWQVMVDQQPAHLYRTNGVYRGVEVSVGHHVIVYHYLPQDVQWGALGAAVTLLICGGVCAWLRRTL